MADLDLEELGRLHAAATRKPDGPVSRGQRLLLAEKMIAALPALLDAAREGGRSRELRRGGSPSHVALWDAINAYVVACGGSTGRISTARMKAVVGVEAALAGKGGG